MSRTGMHAVLWQDFDLSPEWGPLLALGDAAVETDGIRVFRRRIGLGGHANGTIRKMGTGEPSQSIQETGQGKGPARMVGGSSSALTNGCSPTIGMEAGPEAAVAVGQSSLRNTGGEG